MEKELVRRGAPLPDDGAATVGSTGKRKRKNKGKGKGKSGSGKGKGKG
jgi:hypothetical protein